MKKFLALFLYSILIVPIGCDDPIEIDCCPDTPANIWQPKPGPSFDWILTEDVEAILSSPADVIDVDAFWATAELVDSLHALGKKVIGYVSVGTLEDWRPDVEDFPNSVVGRTYDAWPDERWLDIRNITELGPLLEARLDMIAAKGFDAVEPDNLDAFSHDGNTGFRITETETHIFCVWLIGEAHKRGLSIGQKNILELAPKLSAGFDWVLTEDAYYWDEIELANPYSQLGKAIFATEYTDLTNTTNFDGYCTEAEATGVSVILKERDLTAWLMACK